MGRAELELLREKLERGLFVENLYEMASICRKLMATPTCLVVFYVLRSIFLEVAQDWEDRPVEVKEATAVEEKLRMPIRQVLQAVEDSQTKENLLESLAKLITAHMEAIS